MKQFKDKIMTHYERTLVVLRQPVNVQKDFPYLKQNDIAKSNRYRSIHA
jgi:hypothetical protein